MTQTFDAAIVGAGILGLAHAYHLARKGKRVAVFERRPRAEGASIRNFGMVWPIGQQTGPQYELTMRSREHWLNVLSASGLWHNPAGSLHVAYREDEERVLREFVANNRSRGVELLDARGALARCRWLRPDGLRAALWSATEVCVDPRQVIGRLPDWLHATYGVEFFFDTTVIGYERPRVRTPVGTWEAQHLVVCSGDDFRTLYPEAFAPLNIRLCKLQMMRSQPFGADVRLGPLLAAGLTLLHYKAFADCPSLPALRSRMEAEYPEHWRFDIHVMASQHAAGEITIGDSHEYDAIDPFDKQEIDDLILDYLNTFLAVPGLRIASRWHGIYSKQTQQPFFVLHPAPGATAVAVTCGLGMTYSFGLAEKVIDDLLGGKG